MLDFIEMLDFIDNVGFHRSPMVREMLELRGFEYKYLPPYSPFFMGIECLFSSWKKHVKEGLHGHHVRNNCMAYLAGVRVFDN